MCVLNCESVQPTKAPCPPAPLPWPQSPARSRSQLIDFQRLSRVPPAATRFSTPFCVLIFPNKDGVVSGAHHTRVPQKPRERLGKPDPSVQLSSKPPLPGRSAASGVCSSNCRTRLLLAAGTASALHRHRRRQRNDPGVDHAVLQPKRRHVGGLYRAASSLPVPRRR